MIERVPRVGSCFANMHYTGDARRDAAAFELRRGTRGRNAAGAMAKWLASLRTCPLVRERAPERTAEMVDCAIPTDFAKSVWVSPLARISSRSTSDSEISAMGTCASDPACLVIFFVVHHFKNVQSASRVEQAADQKTTRMVPSLASTPSRRATACAVARGRTTATVGGCMGTPRLPLVKVWTLGKGARLSELVKRIAPR